ncbi:hypothetical protein VPH35_077212 [Triticum aestivum]
MSVCCVESTYSGYLLAGSCHSTMSLRRHVHLLLVNQIRCAHQLRLLKRDHLFYPTEEAAAKTRALPSLRKVPPDSPFGTIPKRKKKQAAPSDQLRSVKLPPPVFSVQPSPCPTACNGEARVQCFPLSGSMVFFTDSGARTAFFDTEARCMVTAPNLHSPKCHPMALSVPSPGPGGEQDGGDHSLYIMDTQLDPYKPSPFEALIYRKHPDSHDDVTKTWHRDTLPLPPFLNDWPHRHCISISSYSVVGDVICVSADGLGTYCFDTASRAWSRAGDWQMPFCGKAEGHEPKRRYVWGDPHLPKEWLSSFDGPTSIVHLGSGRFCITNYFEDMNNSMMDRQTGPVGETIVVFTGLEVLSGKGSGKGNGIRMIKHKSCTISSTNEIETMLVL